MAWMNRAVLVLASKPYEFGMFARLSVVGLFLLAVSTVRAAPPAPVDFNRDIRPILSDNCFRCHGPDTSSREADLRLDVEQAAKADRDGHVVVAAGQADKSELIRRITSDDEAERMPPQESGKQLSPAQIQLLKRWISEGAAWSLAWAYVPPKRVTAPTPKDSHWPLNWVDQFILARLETEGLAPSKDADKITLVRRLFIDLVGLPPTPEEVDTFVADESPQAYEQLVDRLLASPRFGERMAMYWLDLVRYADTVGYHGDQDHSISPYRDYAIDAFNRNLPFDQFTREQLAGDLLPNPSQQQRIATGYNRLLQTSHEGGVQPKEYLAIYAADRVRNLSVVWMGATLGCAQCHDHKYDPYTSRDFYSMQAFFADIDEAKHFGVGTNSLPTRRPPELNLPTEAQRIEVAALDTTLEELQRQEKDAKAKVPASKDATVDKSAVENAPTGKGPVEGSAGKKPAADTPTNTAGDNAKADRAKADKSDALSKQIAEIEKKLKSVDQDVRKCMITVAVEPRTIRVLPRGNWLDESGPIVQPVVPEFLGKLTTADRRATRLDLANWLTDAKQGVGGLTARVMANRFWFLFFGAGLSPSLDDFGGQGQPPTHPELLDALALEFVEHGWDVKHLIKLMVMSRAYRQASDAAPELRQRDPLNRLIARQASFRYPAETVRDTALSIGGLLLVDATGGPSVKPYQPPRYYRHLNFPEREYEASAGNDQWRRGVYVHWQRQYLHPMLKAFDAPTREECTAERPRSNTPVAALVMLNDPTFVEASRAFAARILHQGGTTDVDRLDFAFRQAVSRRPLDGERELLESLRSKSRDYYAAHSAEADRMLHVGLKPTPEGLDHIELATWTVVARAILNMNEAISRN